MDNIQENKALLESLGDYKVFYNETDDDYELRLTCQHRERRENEAVYSRLTVSDDIGRLDMFVVKKPYSRVVIAKKGFDVQSGTGEFWFIFNREDFYKVAEVFKFARKRVYSDAYRKVLSERLKAINKKR